LAWGCSEDIAHRLSNHIGLIGFKFSLKGITEAKHEGYFKVGHYLDEMQQPTTIKVDEYRKDERSR
jgi:hypothetical protein